jgi:hypothetical protein
MMRNYGRFHELNFVFVRGMVLQFSIMENASASDSSFSRKGSGSIYMHYNNKLNALRRPISVEWLRYPSRIL